MEVTSLKNDGLLCSESTIAVKDFCVCDLEGQIPG